MAITAQLADGRLLQFPDDTDPSVIDATVKRLLAESAAPAAPQEGIGAAFKGGFKRFGSGFETALESIIDPQLAAERGLERGQKISEQYAPGASLERVKQKYEQDGLFSAAKEAVSQIPGALAEQAPNMAAALGGARLGAMAGAPIGGPVGALVGGGVGALAAALPGLYASNLERQAQEGKQVERSTALGAAAPAAALEVVSQYIPLGRNLVGKILGPTAEKALARGSNEAIEQAAKESLLGSVTRGGAAGLLSEIPTEVTQQMLERLQAGLPLTTPDALAEYGEAAYGAGLVGGPFGAIARTVGRPAARAQYEQLQQQQAALEEPATPEIPSNITELPEGYSVARDEVGKITIPSFNIMAPGAESPLATVDTEEEAQNRLQRYTEIRQQEREKYNDELDKIDDGVQKMQTKLDYMEATQQTGSEEYQQLKANFPAYMEDAAQKKTDLLNKIEAYGQPLEITPAGQTEQVQEQFTVRDKAGQPVQSFKTMGEAEAFVRDTVGEQPFKAAQERSQAMKALEENLTQTMRGFGLKNVALKLVDQIEHGAFGAYGDNLIRVAMSDKNPLQTMRHESIHALKDLGFFTPQQWKALESRAKSEWIKTYLEGTQTEIDGQPMTRLEGYKKLGRTDDIIIEEAIADAFAAYDKGQTPPPGLIASLFKRLKEFFARLKQAMNGAGFQTAEDIFQSIERGELKPSLKVSEKADKYSLVRLARPDEVEISTQNPTGKTHAYDPITQMLSIDEKAVMEAMASNPEFRDRTIAAIKSYGFIPEGVKNKDVIPLFKQSIVNNLVYLYNKVPDDIRQRSKLWYDGANKISVEMADKYGLSLRQVAAIMAAMSPQKDWFQNVSMGERAIDILTQQGDRSWSPEMLQYAESYVKETKDRAEREKRQADFEKIQKVTNRGTTLNEMDIKSAAAFIRAYDEAFHSRQYRIVTPEGGFGDVVRNNDGTPSIMMWSTYGPIEKAVSIYRDGSRENVSEKLGFEHKIRSFYNNIAAPNSDIENVTIDTHAVAAALFESLAGTDPEVVQNFGGTGKSSVFGVGGTYGLIADAYRDAAKQVGVLPREMQSITWEAVRGLFNEDIKSSIKAPIREEWAKYRAGEQSFEQAREKIVEISRAKRTNDKDVDIPPPDWVGSGEGDFVENGGESYNKDYTPEGGVRLRESQEIRDKFTFNLSAVTGSIPGLRELYSRALKRDEKATAVLQTVAESSLKHLLSGTNARVNIERAKGVYLSDREPSLMVSAAFQESEGKNVLAALARFAKNFNQEQIHVRMATKKKFGFDYGDGSYVTRVYTIPLKKGLNDKAISGIIDQTGLKGFTVTDKELITYFVKPTEEQGESGEQYAKRVSEEIDKFAESVASAHVLAGQVGERVGKKDERLFVYGEGYGAAISYESISGDVLPKQSADTTTPRIVAEYLTGEPVQVFKQKPLNKATIKEQQRLAEVFDNLPVNDLKNPLVKKAYKALTKVLREQFAVLPVKVELQTEKDADGNIVAPYGNSSAKMRKDIVDRNHMLVYPTTPSSFGPEGFDFTGHPLLEDSGFKDIKGKPMLFNDVLRAVHDYFAHGMAEAEFGPSGEYTAWLNHMASTPDAMARWALTAETRQQNAWQNFRPGMEQVPLKDRPFSLQKAALPPVEFLFTGDAAVDSIVSEMVESLPEGSKKGSKPDVRYSLKTYFPTAKEAETAAYQKAPPSTPEFKRFFGASKIMDEGRPQVMYHGSPNIVEEFNENKPIFVTPDAEFAEQFAEDRAKDNGLDPDDLKVYPLWVRAETPFDYEDPEHVDLIVNKITLDQKLSTPDAVVRLKQSSPRVAKFRQEVTEGLWSVIEDPVFQDALKSTGFDSFNVKEGGNKNLAVFKANQVKSVTGNIGEFGENKNIKFSLPSLTAAENDAVNRTTTVRESKGYVERILDAVSPKNYSYFRQAALNRYEALSVADKIYAQQMGSPGLRASQSAEAAAHMSDLHAGVAASVFGIQGRRGGVPVFKNGMTTVDHSKKGLVAILSPLAKFGDPRAYRDFQFYSGVKRGMRLMASGPAGYTEKLFEPADIKLAESIRQKYEAAGIDFEAVRKDWVTFNDSVTDYLVQTGVLSKEDAQKFKKYADYIPFYRQLEGEKTLGPNIFQSLSGVSKPKALGKGGEAPLADFMETIVRNTHAAITAGMKNAAEQKIINVGKQVGIINDIAPGSSVRAEERVKVLINGVKHEYQCTDQMFADATRSLNMPDLPFISFLSKPADLLRNMITREPGFIMTNLLRDSVSAYVTSGVNITPISGTLINFGKAMKGNSPEFEAMMDAGIIGGYEFSANAEQSGERLTADLMKKSGKGSLGKRAFDSVWDGLEKATTASDAATRMAVYERVLAETGDEAEALYRALEVMNFNRKGSSAVVRILTAAVPFLNARMQGLDVFYRAITGKMNNADAKEIQAKFFRRGMMIMGLSTMYYFAVAGNPDYEKQEQETKDNNWLIPGSNVRIPIPFEVGILFKTIPERIAAYTFGNDTGKDFLDAMKRAANGFVPVSPAAYIPQTFKPIIEAMTNYSFFTQREIVGMGLKDVAPEFQVGPGTSAFAEFVGKTLGLSPIKVDYVFKGYTGTMGMYAVDLMDMVMDLNSDSPKPTKRFEQLPIIKRLVLDPEARGNVTNYYQLKDSVDTTVRTMNLLEKSGKPEEFAEYVRENAGTLAMRSYVSDLEKTMKELRDMKGAVRNSTMSGDQKRDAITAIGQAENNLTTNIQTVKQVIEKAKP